MLLLGMGGLCATVPAARAGQAAGTAAAQSADAASHGNVGGNVCASCHAEESGKLAAKPHGGVAALHGGAGVDCEGCHGPGKAHVESGGDRTKIFSPSNATAGEVDAKCLSCHQGKQRDFERSAHGAGNVSCIGCHDMHDSTADALLKAPQDTLCFQCHAGVKPEFSMPVHHEVNEGVVQCSDCHDLHGAVERKSIQSVIAQDAVCLKCHAGKAGPWVHEHAVIKTEGCLACHTPHGGQYPRLLNRASVNSICLQCHSPATNFSDSTPAGSHHNQAPDSESCLDCHVDIHGSNSSALFLHGHR